MVQDNTRQSDEAIIAQVTGGDVDSYALILERYEKKLFRYVIYLIHDPEIAADVVQDTFIKTYQNLNAYKSKYKFSSWIYRIAHNEAMNAVRRNRFTVKAQLDALPEASYDPRMDEKIDAAIMKAHVHGCLQKLDQRYREVIQLYYFEHMKYDEVSDVLHIPASTVGVRLSRAKSLLRRICAQKGAAHENH